MRSGLIAKKIGMTRVFSNEGLDIPVTVLKLENVQVTGILSYEKNGYTAVQVGAGNKKLKNVTKSLKGHFSKSKIEAKKVLKEFIVSDNMILKEGDTFAASHFVVGQKIDVTGISIGKGFSGAMKRHNFSGLRASHGVSISHRSHGSTGNSQDPGKVWKGKKMAGQYGNVQKTVQNLTVVNIDEEEDLIFVKGSVPGPKNSFVTVKDAIKFKFPDNVKTPAGLKNVEDNLTKKQDDTNETKEKNNNDEVIHEQKNISQNKASGDAASENKDENNDDSENNSDIKKIDPDKQEIKDFLDKSKE